MGPMHIRDLPTRPMKRDLRAYTTTYWFDQLIDHNDSPLGKFQQRCYFSAELHEPAFHRRLRYAKQDRVGSGASVVWEHRCVGLSNPYPDLEEERLIMLTTWCVLSERGSADGWWGLGRTG
ncbi:hypothetical protein BDZ89DRAFT_1070139 [Hymenopellis radicata]|nr:hypothetical protein BDZ89DRAFT_1070139 [Hymenopellis radicata]